jgi:hypothetical protein
MIQLADVLTERYISRHCWNVASYKWKVHTGKIEIMSFVVVSLSAPHSISNHRSSYEADLPVSVVSFISTSKPHQKCKEKHKKS